MTWCPWFGAIFRGGRMAELDALANLRDIHLPAPISWWPLAPAWYVLFLVLSVILVGIIYMAKRRYQHSYPKRQALLLLKLYEQEWQTSQQSSPVFAQISQLLRQVALMYFPRDEVASLQGDAWLIFLSQTSTATHFMELHDDVLVFPYQPHQQGKNPDAFFNNARAWIAQRGRPCLN